MSEPTNTKSIIEPVTEAEASYTVSAVATYYPDFTKVYIPNIPYHKLKPGFEFREQVAKSDRDPIDDSDRSIRRTKKTVKDYVLCNRFELFATFTFATNRQDIDHCKRRMNNWLKNQKKRRGGFDYLIVPELHSDKTSLHFHALIRGYNGKIEVAINPKTGKPVIKGKTTFYTLPGYTLGFTNVKIIDYSNSGHLKLARYVSKYITKDMPLFAQKNRYWGSHGLKLPEKEDNPADWYKAVVPYKTINLDHGKLLFFHNADIGRGSHE